MGEEKKSIRFWDLVFLNVSAIFGIRWIAKSTASSFGLGLGAIPMWILFSFIFFVPQALICAELAATYPRNGGLYEWVKEAYGEKWGFIVSWLNWTAKIFWYSSFLTFFAVNISYVIGRPALADNKIFVLALSLVVFWAITLLSTKGIQSAKFFSNVGALGSTIPAALLIIMALLSVVLLKKVPSASVYTAASLTPKLNANSFVAISSIMFGLAGAEVSANFAREIENPKRNFPKAILTAALIIAGLYVLGSVAITMILTPDEITASKGVLDALGKVATTLGIGPWFIRLLAAGISLSVIGAIIVYIISPIRMLFGSIREGILPKRFTDVNKYDIPANAAVLQAIIVSIILLVTSLMPSVDTIYNVLVTMTALTSLFPYVLLFMAYIRLRKDRPNEARPYEVMRSNSSAILFAQFVLLITLIGILFSAAPVMPTLAENIAYEIEMIGGAIVIIGVGLLFWRNYEKKKQR